MSYDWKKIMAKHNHNILWDHEAHLKRAFSKRGIATIGQAVELKKISLKQIYVGDKVMTPLGSGKVRIIDEDDTICVDIDPESDVLHEFDRKEVYLFKGAKKKKRRK